MCLCYLMNIVLAAKYIISADLNVETQIFYVELVRGLQNYITTYLCILNNCLFLDVAYPNERKNARHNFTESVLKCQSVLNSSRKSAGTSHCMQRSAVTGRTFQVRVSFRVFINSSNNIFWNACFELTLTSMLTVNLIHMQVGIFNNTMLICEILLSTSYSYELKVKLSNVNNSLQSYKLKQTNIILKYFNNSNIMILSSTIWYTI